MHARKPPRIEPGQETKPPRRQIEPGQETQQNRFLGALPDHFRKPS